MATANEIEIRVSVDDKTRAPFRKIEQNLKRSADRAGKQSGDKAGDSWLKGFSSTLSRGLSGTGKAFAGITKGMAGIASIGTVGNLIAGTAGAVKQLTPALLLLPAAVGAAGAAFATLKVATSGFGDAIKAIGDPKKFAEAIKDMAPSAKQTAVALRDMNPALKALKKEVQGKFFDNFAIGIKNLAKVYLPILTKGMGGVAEKMNVMARTVGHALMMPGTVKDVNKIFAGTVGMLGKMRNSLAYVVSGFLALSGAGATYLPKLGAAIDNVTHKFAAWASELVNSGRFNELVDHAIAGFKDLGTIVGNVGSVIASIFRGLGASMASPLSGLAELTTKVAEFFKTIQVQDALKALGEVFRTVGEAVQNVLLVGLKAVTPIIGALAPAVSTLATFIGGALTTAINAIAPAIMFAAQALGPFIQQIADMLTPALRELTPVLGHVAMDLMQLLVDAIREALPILPPLISSIVSVTKALYPLIPPLVEIAQDLLPIFADVLKVTAGIIKSVVVPAITHVLIPALRGPIELVRALTQVWKDSWGKVKEVTRVQIDAIKGILSGRALFESGKRLIMGFIDGIRDGFNIAIAIAKQKLAELRRLFPFSPAKEGPFSGMGYTTHSGKALMEDFGKGMQAGLPKLQAITAGALGSTRGGLIGSAAALTSSAPRRSTGVATAGGATNGRIIVEGTADSALAALLTKMARTGELRFVLES